MNAKMGDFARRLLHEPEDRTLTMVEGALAARVLEQRNRDRENMATMIGNAVARSLGG